MRQSGKDAVTPVKVLKKKLKIPETPGDTTPVSPKETTAQAVKKLKINETPGSLTGKVIINEKQDGDTWVITLNSKHAMFESFVKKIRSKK